MPEQRLLDHAKRMRHAPTEAEALLWRHLRGKRFSGYKFKRQQPIGPFIVDFVCLRRKLVIEADGGQHGDAADYDSARTAWMERQGFRVPGSGTTMSCNARWRCWIRSWASW